MKREEHNSVKQEQLHDLLFSREIGWQEIIYDLINTEQLDPWNINITILTGKYLEKIRSLEEADFFVSSKVLLAAAFLLRIKSEILLNKYIKSIDEILFGDKNQRVGLEKGQILTIDFEEPVPELIPKSPMPRFRRVTLQELMESLNKAIATENRRIKKEIINTNALREAEISLPKKKFNIKNKIRELYERLLQHFTENRGKTKVSFTDFIGTDKENRILSFSPLLHLDHQKKIWLEQEQHFGDFYIWLKETYLANNPDPFADLRKEVEEEIEEEKEFDEEKKKRLAKISKDFENPLGELAE
ncbi:MAG TPA: segregation/condensation protein A [Candidatus Nanoarchaeia archaeon]|nr:segregation/condensation protein A [Candidatus Nanoarchaeia archaeon]